MDNQQMTQELQQLNAQYPINNLSEGIRELLTSTQIQNSITDYSGALIITKGKHTTYEVKNQPPSTFLHLDIKGPKQQNLDLAIEKIQTLIQQYNDGRTYTNGVEKVFVGLEQAPLSYLKNKILGVGNNNLHCIMGRTGALVTLRGHGSGFIESNGKESTEPLHILVEHPKNEVLQYGKVCVFHMIDSIRYDYYLHAGSYHGRCPMPPPYVARPQPNVHQQFPMICQSIETNNGYIRKIAPTNYLQQQNGNYQVQRLTQNTQSPAYTPSLDQYQKSIMPQVQTKINQQQQSQYSFAGTTNVMNNVQHMPLITRNTSTTTAKCIISHTRRLTNHYTSSMPYNINQRMRNTPRVHSNDLPFANNRVTAFSHAVNPRLFSSSTRGDQIGYYQQPFDQLTTFSYQQSSPAEIQMQGINASQAQNPQLRSMNVSNNISMQPTSMQCSQVQMNNTIEDGHQEVSKHLPYQQNIDKQETSRHPQDQNNTNMTLPSIDTILRYKTPYQPNMWEGQNGIHENQPEQGNQIFQHTNEQQFKMTVPESQSRIKKVSPNNDIILHDGNQTFSASTVGMIATSDSRRNTSEDNFRYQLTGNKNEPAKRSNTTKSEDYQSSSSNFRLLTDPSRYCLMTPAAEFQLNNINHK